MIPAPTVAPVATRQLPKVLVSASARAMGTGIMGERGTGKTTLEGDLACQGIEYGFPLLNGFPQVLLDPLGTLTPALLYHMTCYLQHVPPRLHKRFWKRVRYIDLGNTDVVTPFPIYYRTGSENLREVAERFIDTIRLAYPKLVSQASVTFPNLRRVGVNAGMVLAALGYQLTEAEDLLFNTLAWEKSGRFEAAVKRDPEAAPAVTYFREHYLPLSRSAKNQLTSAFLDHVFPFSHDANPRLLFSAKTPGLDWEEIEARGQTVILDFRNVSDPETKRFALLWIFLSLYDYLKRRGRRQKPFCVYIDEFAALCQQVTDGVNPLAQRLDEFLNQYMRNNQVWFTCAYQSITQLDEQLRNTILSLGNLVVGHLSMPDARVLADVLWKKDPYWVKFFREEWVEEEQHYWVKTDWGYNRETKKQWVLRDWEPVGYLSLDEQRELFAQRIEALQAFEFFLRPALREGTISQAVIPISIESLVRDPASGEYQFPDQELMAKFRAVLATRSGTPAATIRAEQEKRLAEGVIQTPPQPGQKPRKPPVQPVATPVPATAEEERLPAVPAPSRRMEDEARPVPRSTKKTQSLPTLDDKEHSFLTFITEHPDTPVSVVYKGLGVGVALGTKIRDSLKAQGLVEELEIRTNSASGGRPTKCLIPTFAALELLGKDVPTGRGGTIHRHVQQVVAKGASAKGYIARVEYTLSSGAIVDVHLKNREQRIAVEIAIASTPEQEISHMRNCLSVGYAQVYTIFADEHLLGRTAIAMQNTFSGEELGQIRLLPLRQLAQVW